MLAEDRPSILRVIQIDYWAFLSTIFPALLWVFYIYDAFFRQTTTPNLLYIVIAITVACAVVSFWRYQRILSVYGAGIEAKATITSIGFYRDRGHIAYIYPYQGKKYLSKNTVLKTKHTQKYQVGDEVDVLIDRDNPKHAIIRELFI